MGHSSLSTIGKKKGDIMKVLLTLILREQDNNIYKTEKRLYKFEELLMEPALHTSLKLKDDTIFYIDYLIQDLVNDVVVLINEHDTYYRSNWIGWSNEIPM